MNIKPNRRQALTAAAATTAAVSSFGFMRPALAAADQSNVVTLMAGIQISEGKREEAIAVLQAGNLARAIEIVLAYYDKTYLKAAKAMPRNEMPSLSIDDLSDAEIVVKSQEIADSLSLHRVGNAPRV